MKFRLADGFSCARILLGVLLYVLAFQQQRMVFVLVFLVAGLTDLLDGFVARKMGTTARGAFLDGIADRFIFVSSVVWVWLLRPEVIPAVLPWLAVFVLLEVGARVMQYRKFGKFGSYHLMSGKIAAVLAYVFVVDVVLAGFRPILWYALVAMAVVNYVEECVVTRRLKRFRHDVHSAFLRK